MQRDCFTFRSITAAMQAQSLLSQSGIHSVLQRTPAQLRTNGCGYCLNTPSHAATRSVLHGQYQKLYQRTEHGSWQEV